MIEVLWKTPLNLIYPPKPQKIIKECAKTYITDECVENRIKKTSASEQNVGLMGYTSWCYFFIDEKTALDWYDKARRKMEIEIEAQNHADRLKSKYLDLYDKYEALLLENKQLKEEIAMEKGKKEIVYHPDIVCPVCGRPIAWWNEYVQHYMCSSAWEGVDKYGKTKPCSDCAASLNQKTEETIINERKEEKADV